MKEQNMSEFLENLEGKVFQNEYLVLFDEATKCLANGARRAAYIATWIAVAESIRGKFKVITLQDQ